jgi:hypothetical protein
MANQPRMANVAANAAADAVCALLNNGYLRLYDGTQPATGDTAVSGQVLLAELRFNATAFGAASGGVATANAIASDSAADASGTATWARALKSDGSTAIFDMSAGTASADLILASSAISAGATVAVASLSYTQSKT